MTDDIHQTIIGTYLNDVVILQTDITCQATVENELIDIDYRHQPTLTIQLDVTQRTDIVSTSGTIECMEHGRQGTQSISSRHTNLTQHIDLNGACLAQCRIDFRTLEIASKLGIDTRFGCADRQSANMNGTIFRHIDFTLRTYRQLQVLGRSAIDIDNELVARTQNIVLRRGNVHIGLESQRLVVKDITAKHLLADDLRSLGKDLTNLDGSDIFACSSHHGIV